MTAKTSRARVLALTTVAALVAAPATAETWVLPGGIGMELGDAEGDRLALETPLGSGTAIELEREEVGDAISTRFSDGRIGEVEGVDLQAEFFFLDLEGRQEGDTVEVRAWDLERLRAGVPPGSSFVGQANETEVLQAVASLERFHGQLPEGGGTTGTAAWTGLSLDAIVLGALHGSLPGLARRLGVEAFGLEGDAEIAEGDATTIAGTTLVSVNGLDTHRVSFDLQVAPEGLSGAEIRVAEEGKTLAAVREEGRLEALGNGLIGAAAQGALMAAGIGPAASAEAAAALQGAVMEGGTLVLSLAPDSPVPLTELLAWPDLPLAERQGLAERLGLALAREAD